VVAHGQGVVLTYQAVSWLTNFIQDVVGGSAESFTLEKAGADYNLKDGVWVADLDIVDDGPGDWPGSRESLLQVKRAHPVTQEEWVSYLDGDWPWEPVEDEPGPPLADDLLNLDG
jgi:hypothetical protein